MLIYEVNLDIQPDTYSAFKDWLDSHVKEMLQFPGFISAQILSAEPNHLTVHYQLESRGHLEEYFGKHAARMRQQGIDAFGGQFQATRRILESVA